MSKRTIYVDPEEGPYIGNDSWVADLASVGAILAALAVACVLVGWLNGWDIPQLLSLLGVK